MRAELVRGHVLLLLDGLDEVAGADSRRQVIDAVRAFAAEQPQCRMVVACRVRAYEGAQNSAWQLPGWPAATLADWTRGQMEQFVAAWYAAVVAAGGLAEQRRTERVQSLQRAISAREDLQRLGVRPLLLTIMALVHLNDGRLPEDRVSLYSRSVDILLAQWEQRGKDASEFGSLMDYVGLPNSGSTALRPLLARAAFAAHEAAKPGEVGRLSRPVLRTMVDDELKRLGHPNPSHGADRFLEYTDLRAGLIQSNDVGDEYAFPHQTFQEYLGGLALISGAQFVDEIMRRRHDDRWRVPIFLGLGHAVSEGLFAQSYQVLSRLLHARGRDQARRQRDLIFAYELADDVGWDRLERAGAEFSALHEALARELADVVEGTALPAAERVQAGIYLGRLGDPRPGVCSLPPAMVTFEAGDFGIGITRAEYHAIVKQEKRSDLEQEAREWYKDSINSAATRVARFALARYPVTNAQYALFIADDGYNTERRWWDAAGRAWLQQATQTEPRFWEDERFGSTCPNHPVVGVAWYEAMAFCRWLTLHLHDGFVYTLPSEAEWEYAARGAARRVYPWGDAAPGAERANFSGAHNGTTPVGSFSAGATPERLLDMAGNAWEWTRSVYRPYPYDPQDGRESLDSPASKYFTLRGGSWYDRSINLRAALRNNNTPDDQISLIGFRLARHLPV
jgi:formylglycine-generating enzyme required for sulfatase activity